ncbi:mRNA cleavage and polyadenylation factor subunit [Malassezia psittaci]|uniref:mRNA cleavage and polyadenylation factor subunit n=1 Tax=Malassezia psittaci TaxID=1821823 RepID=A0AAF0FAG2_9BASI|nr:mRNA cleavage and polyadenylation factor subunit [Malassezia psittaci]
MARDDLLTLFEVRARGDQREFVQLRMHRLYGEVTGVMRVRTVASQFDHRDRILVSFRDAKMALMEWNDAYSDLHTVSIHTFERSLGSVQSIPRTFVPALRVDPNDQCAVLLLPQDALAVLPFYQDVGDMRLSEDNRTPSRIVMELPYAPSFLLSLPNQVDASIKNLRDLLFLPGFQKPTLAVLYEAQLTWTGNLSEEKQTMRVCFITLDWTISHYPVTVTSGALPYDCLYLVGCPRSLGGVMIVTPSAILHMDTTGRLTGLQTNQWYNKTSTDLPLAQADVGPLDLQSSQLVFTHDTSALLFLVDGNVYTLQCDVEGRTVTSLSLSKADLASKAPRSSFALAITEQCVVCASIQGDCVMYAVDTVQSADADDKQDTLMADTTLDQEELDLYGEMSKPVLRSATVETQRLSTLDYLPGLCAVNDMAIGQVRGSDHRISDRTVIALPDGLATLELHLRTEIAHAIAPAQQVFTASLSNVCLLLAAWEEQALVYAIGDPPRFLSQHTKRTLAMDATPDRQYALRITPTDLELLGEDGNADVLPGIAKRESEWAAARIASNFIAVLSSSGEVVVAKYTQKNYEALPITYSSTEYIQMDLFQDALCTLSPAAHTWLITVTVDGSVEMRILPQGDLVWKSKSICVLPSRLSSQNETPEPPATDILELRQVKLVTLGDLPTLVVQYTNGLVAVLEASPPPPMSIVTLYADQPQTLGFVRVDAKMLSAPANSVHNMPMLGDRCCVALCGEHTMILVRDRHGPLQWLETEHPIADLARFSSKSSEDAASWNTIGVQNEEACILRWEPCELNGVCPFTRWTTHREYTRVVCHEETGCIVAASSQPIPFVLYNEFSEPVKDSTQDPMPTISERGALELFACVGQAPVHGYEFEANEVVSALHVAALDTRDRYAGRRTFIAVGTITTYGEDRITKGHMYVFEVVEAVPYDLEHRDTFQLRQVCKEEMRAPVTALCDMNGYLVAAVGQKLVMRSLEFNEWLVTIAFLETQFYTTSIRRVKNFLLLTDYHRSASFVAFQEEPAKLFLLGRDFSLACLTHGAFLIQREKLALITTDVDGVLRFMDYNPANPTSLGGQRLLTRVEYYLGNEVVQALTLPGAQDAASKQCFTSEVVLARRNGAIDVLVPVEDKVFAILQLFQSQLVRSVRHTAGLNPRSFRAVQNLHVSRPLSKGVLDGCLLHAAERMSRPKLVRLVGDLQPRTGDVQPDDVLACLLHLQPQWG